MSFGSGINNIHILIVDDQIICLIDWALRLRDLGYRISSACDGQEALEKVLTHLEKGTLYDLLITDIEMPNMTGTEMVVKLREHNISMPVIFISGQGPEVVVSALPDEEWFAYLRKPFEFSDLVRLVKYALNDMTFAGSVPKGFFQRKQDSGNLGKGECY